MPETAPSFTLHLDSSAQERIMEALAEEGAWAVRVYVQGGGCSGFTYQFDFAEAPADDDWTIEHKEGRVRVVVDSLSAAYLQGATLRFDDSLWERRFVLDNPNAQQTCGCGSSFAPGR